MKKLTLCAIAALALIACGNTEKPAPKADTTVVEVEEVVEETPVAPDLAMQELTGPVKTMHIKTGSCDSKGKPDNDNFWIEYNFVYTTEGKFDVKDKKFDWRLNNPKIKRNDEGQVEKVSWYISDYDFSIYEKYTYTRLGHIKTLEALGVESTATCNYNYDVDGMLISSYEESAGEGMIYQTNTTYKILESDKRGNWTKRLKKISSKTAEDDGKYNYGSADNFYEIELRTITYYE